jgi:hypothetical protein
LFSIIDFLEDMKLLKAKYGHHRPNLDLNILRWPAFMSPLALPDDVKIKLRSDLVKWYDENKDSDLFVQGEKAQLERLIDYLDVVQKGHTTTENDKELLFHDFKSFYTQYDKRRKKSFVETFPELEDWYNSIEIDKTIPDVKVTDGRITHYEPGEYISDKDNYNK